ncbi:hypothetical protein OIU79_016937 [Salix purpurea]|uniref:Uncharacterized protein n=1 Tax=Salix purpurea TaxID=77065 RepID=A0A9Q1AJJ9_SALPP|nr:hypothetical protein OIU79_016937 [Salix purpurea]
MVTHRSENSAMLQWPSDDTHLDQPLTQCFGQNRYLAYTEEKGAGTMNCGCAGTAGAIPAKKTMHLPNQVYKCGYFLRQH